MDSVKPAECLTDQHSRTFSCCAWLAWHQNWRSSVWMSRRLQKLLILTWLYWLALILLTTCLRKRDKRGTNYTNPFSGYSSWLYTDQKGCQGSLINWGQVYVLAWKAARAGRTETYIYMKLLKLINSHNCHLFQRKQVVVTSPKNFSPNNFCFLSDRSQIQNISAVGTLAFHLRIFKGPLILILKDWSNTLRLPPPKPLNLRLLGKRS